MISVITPVRDRPKGFKLCEYWLSRQTFKDFEWIVVDDGKTPVVPSGIVQCKRDLHYIRRKNNYRRQTTYSNIACGLEVRNFDRAVIVEDDDWHGKNFLKDLIENQLDGENQVYDVVASCPHRVYNVKQRVYTEGRSDVKQMRIKGSGVLSMSGLWDPGDILLRMQTGARQFWKQIWKRYKVNIVLTEFVAIKGIPGLHAGRRHDHMEGTRDPKGKKLIEWIGEEDAYRFFATVQQ